MDGHSSPGSRYNTSLTMWLALEICWREGSLIPPCTDNVKSQSYFKMSCIRAPTDPQGNRGQLLAIIVYIRPSHNPRSIIFGKEVEKKNEKKIPLSALEPERKSSQSYKTKPASTSPLSQ